MIILKIIGILLLSILVLLVTVSLIILFSAIKYDLEFSYAGELKIKFKVLWIFHALRFSFAIENGTSSTSLKFLFYDFLKKKKGNVADEEDELIPDIESAAEHIKDEAKSQSENSGNLAEGIKAAVKNPEEKGSDKDEGSGKSKEEKSGGNSNFLSMFGRKNMNKKKDDEPKRDFDKEDKLSYKIKKFFEIGDKAEIISHTIKLATDLLKVIKPKRFKAWFIVGTDDPCLTSEIIGLLYAAGAMAFIDVAAVPDYESVRFEGELRARGKTTLKALGYPFLVLLLKKPVRALFFGKKKEPQNETTTSEAY